MLLGVDVSAWQDHVDWSAMRFARPDIRFAYIRAGGGSRDGVWQQLDPQAWRNGIAAPSRGIAVGGYLPTDPQRMSPEETALEGVGYLREAGLLRPGCLVPALDIEDKTQDWSRWADELITVWRELTRRSCGGRVIVYSSGSFFDTYLRNAFDRADTTIGVWAAHWNNTPGATRYTVGGRTMLHQYTDKGTLPGVTGNIDLDATMPGARLTDWMIES